MTTKKYLKKIGGFTLVELLIVIAILAIIALIVIAAINPIEQANRARDTGQKADASQLVSAIDRYFAARIEYPWVAQVAGAGNDDLFGFVTVADYRVGLCAEDIGGGTTDCDNDGELITTSELKTEFRNRRFIDAYDAASVVEQDYLMIGKENNVDSVYVCYTPMANSNRTRGCDDMIVYTLDASNGERSPVDPCVPEDVIWSTSNNLAASAFVCVPE